MLEIVSCFWWIFHFNTAHENFWTHISKCAQRGPHFYLGISQSVSTTFEALPIQCPRLYEGLPKGLTLLIRRPPRASRHTSQCLFSNMQ
jgi:hypothetical protein